MSALLTILATASIGVGAPDPVEADIVWIVSGEFCEPETVLPLPDNTLLVSNVCGFGEPGSGFLSLLSADGQVLDWRILEGLDAPLGMALLGDRLHVVDNNRVKIFGWPGYEPLETTALETSVANDIAVAPDGGVFVTDTAGHQVIELRPDGTQSVFTGEPQFKGANGIALHDSHLYIGGDRLWRVDLQSHSVETVGPEWLANIDGIEFESDGTLQVTPVGGPLVRYRSEQDIEILAGEGISSANHGYAANLNLALIPTGFDNTVIAISITSDDSQPGGEADTTTRWESASAAYSALEQFSGRWRGSGEGKWGTSSTVKVFSPVLDGKAMCRGGSSVYPVQERNPRGEVHKAHSLMALVEDGDKLALTEYDNEGYIAHYVLNLSSSRENESWVFELVSSENLPPDFRARLTLHSPRDDQFMEIFELDFNGDGYVTYLTNQLSRVSQDADGQGCLVEE